MNKNLLQTKITKIFGSGNPNSGIMLKLPSHISYLTGILFPYPAFSAFSVGLVLAPGKEQSALIVPWIWKDLVDSAVWQHPIIPYSINDGAPDQAFCEVIGHLIGKFGLEKTPISMDLPAWSANEIGCLSKMLSSFTYSDCSEALWSARMIKSAAEIELLHQAAIIGDRGVIGALNHVEGTTSSSYYTLSEFLERVRVHAIEFGSHGIGHLNLSQGRRGNAWYTPITDFSLVENDQLIRVDYSHQFHGYWNQTSRMLFTGTPDLETSEAFASNQELVRFALSKIKPKKKISQFVQEICAKANEIEADLFAEAGFGHGIGLSEYEAPMLTADNDEVFMNGMVITLDIQTFDAKKQLIHSIETIVVEANRCRKLSDFKNWDSLYRLDGIRANH